MSPAKSDQLRSVQFLRFVAALMVAVYHAAMFVDRDVGAAPRYLMGLTPLGAAGVHIFFVISGFIIVYTTRRHFGQSSYVAEYARRRFIRIFPIYWILAAVNLVALKAFDFGGAETPKEVVLAALLLPGHSSALIFVGWTLSFELFFYIAFAVFIPFARFKAITGLTGLLLILIAVGVAAKPQSAFPGLATSSLLLEFLFGTWIAVLLMANLKLPKWTSILAVALALVGFLAPWISGHRDVPSVISWGVPSALLVYGMLALEESDLLPRFASRLAFLGDSSYSLYLVHAMLLPLATLWLSKVMDATPIQSAALIVFLTASCVAVSHGVYLILERPLIGIAKRAITPR